MKIGRASVVAGLLTAGLSVGGFTQIAAAAVATTTTVIVNNPIGNTPGKIVMTGKVRPTTGTGTPTGTCTFVIDRSIVGMHAVNSRGNCSLTTHVKLGMHTVRIKYGGSATFAASSGSATIDVTH